MKNILLSLLCILGLQSMMMQAAVESKDDYQDKRQAIIDEAMQPENYINLKSGFALLQSQGLNVPSFHDLLEQNVFQSDDEELDLDAITTQAEDIFTLNMKDQFIATLEIALKENKALDHINDPIFVYVMQHKDDFMLNTVHSWLYEWSKTKDKDGATPLHLSARNNSVDVARMLLDAGAELHSKDRNDLTPLHYAASRNNVDVVRMLLDAGADVNIQGNGGWTPLQCATYNRDATEVARILLDAGANPNIQNEFGWAPLHRVAANNNAKVARMLIAAGANINIRSKFGQTPLIQAANRYNNSLEVARILINAGADLRIPYDHGESNEIKDLIRQARQKKVDVPTIAIHEKVD